MTSLTQADTQPTPRGAASTPNGGFSMRHIGRHSLVYGVGVLLSRAVAFIMLPIYTRVLTTSDFGALQLIETTLEVISIIAGSRLAAGVFHYYHKQVSEAGKRAVLSTALVVLVVSYGIASGATFLLAPQIAGWVFGVADVASVGYIRIAAASLFLNSFLVVPLAFLQLGERSMLFVGLNVARLAIQLSLNIVFVVELRIGVTGILLSTLLTNVVFATALTWLLLSAVGMRVSRSAATDLLRFGLPFVATQAATFVATFGDRYFLRSAADTAAVGVYGLAYQFGFLLAAVGYEPFNNYWEPKRFALARRPDRDALYARAFVYFNVLLMTMAVGITLFVGDVIRVMATPPFYGAAAIAPVVVIAYVLQSWTGFHNVGIMLRERTQYITLANWVGAITALVGYVVLIPRWYGMGAAVATVLSFGVRELLVYIWSQRLWRVQYNWGPVARIVALAIGVGVARFFVTPASIGLAIAYHLTLLAIYLASVWLLVIPSGDRASALRLVRERVLIRRQVGVAVTGSD
ncbi:MAG: lipopolysaccharide biosynthesis protein [Gemmatimonadaceae bacterium]